MTSRNLNLHVLETRKFVMAILHGKQGLLCDKTMSGVVKIEGGLSKELKEKHCAKWRNCSLRTISHFRSMFFQRSLWFELFIVSIQILVPSATV